MARLLAVVFRLLFGWSNISAVGSKVHVRRPISLWTGEVLNPSNLECCAKRGLPIMGLVCLPSLSRAVLCRSSQHFPLFHSLVDILDLKFGTRTANLWRNSYCEYQLLQRNRSAAIFCQEREGSSCGWSSSRACAGRYVWQIVQRKTKSLISALILGQYKISRARRTHPPMPMWLL